MPEPSAARAVPTVQVDNDAVRVTEWRFPRGAATGHHRHEYAYVVVPMSTGRLAIETKDGVTTSELVTGQAYFRVAGAEHDVKNANSHEFVFVEIELKSLPLTPHGGAR